MAIKVKVQSDKFNGIRGGVRFVNGIGVFEDEEYGRYIAKSLGYEIIEEVETKKKTEEDEVENEVMESESKRKTTTRKRKTTKKDHQ